MQRESVMKLSDTPVGHKMGVSTLTERDGSFRRLVETVREQRAESGGRVGRPAKNRVPITGLFALHIHDRMKAIAKERTAEADHLISATDLYNEAAIQLIEDLHQLLGDELRLPAGAVTLSGILGLRELIDRPVYTPLRELEFHTGEQYRTTLYFDQAVWDALIEMSMRFGLRMRRAVQVQRLIELAAAWYLAGLAATQP
jgi:hypothetical protein